VSGDKKEREKMSKARKHFNEFAKLRAESEKIGTQLDMPPLPIKRSIEQVAETSRRLAAKTTGSEQIAAKNKGLVVVLLFIIMDEDDST